MVEQQVQDQYAPNHGERVEVGACHVTQNGSDQAKSTRPKPRAETLTLAIRVADPVLVQREEHGGGASSEPRAHVVEISADREASARGHNELVRTAPGRWRHRAVVRIVW
ncbi:MAG: hypothetical protein H0U59_00040 [Gemmatimonadaceae bacterium]|nr:hypothetical protein [Gemmatimonadaceae bacterium]